MKPPSCPRVWEAEAVQDGRLDGSARTSFERHLLACPVCANERMALERLQRMADEFRSPCATPLDRRRLRTAILREGNDRLIAASPRHAWRALAILGGVLITAVIGFWLAKRPPYVAPPPTLSRPVFEILPVGAAEWHIDRADEHVVVKLENGTVAIHVGKLTPGERFVVMLPDGELEVRGTRFIAHVDGGHVCNVTVSEGVVALRLGPASEWILGAGQTWSARQDDVRNATAASSGAPASSQPMAPHRITASAVEGARPPRAAFSPRNLRMPADPSASDIAGKEPRSDAGIASAFSASNSAGVAFEKAMAAFSMGSYETAEVLMADFERRFPDDGRAEDAAFLRVVIQQRAGNAKATRERALDYWRRYPNGFHRAEVEQFIPKRLEAPALHIPITE
jgi:FecR protein